MNQRGQNYLGIDWGSAKIGLALAHPETGIALSLGVLKNDDKFLETMARLLEQESIGTVVLGIPTRFFTQDRGNIQASHPKDRHPAFILGQILRDTFGVTVEYHNEMFTTKMAQEKLIEGGKKDVSREDDAEAARILLESWLTQKR